MSWGYWGIVAGLLALLTVFFFCLDLFYRHEKKASSGESIPGGREETTRVADSKHAA
ncbi:MAG TPA: hypothetical protein VJV04_16415 [Nitrospiraceae bacterium]|nr:hypothetical protein [Nitrospiraceae bacterium]